MLDPSPHDMQLVSNVHIFYPFYVLNHFPSIFIGSAFCGPAENLCYQGRTKRSENEGRLRSMKTVDGVTISRKKSKAARPIGSSYNGVPVPIYAQLISLFRHRIETGEWPVHEQVPTLPDLMKEFGVARATIRHAIGFLEAEGLIGRYRGRGTFVRAKPEIEVWHEIPMDWDSLMLSGADKSVDVEWLACRVAAPLPSASHPGGTLAAGYQFMHRLHRRHGVPYFVASNYVEAAAFAAIGKAGFDDTSLRSLQRYYKNRIGRAMQTVKVAAASIETAKLLDVPLHSPMVVVRRSIFDRDNVLIYESNGFYRGDFVRIQVQLR